MVAPGQFCSAVLGDGDCAVYLCECAEGEEAGESGDGEGYWCCVYGTPGGEEEEEVWDFLRYLCLSGDFLSSCGRA